jgi:ppGpp synthetase/RelA/SpoT-type nucleotidyltranferase
MAILYIHTFLVHPRKGAISPPPPNGTIVPLSGKLFDLLEGIYARSDQECDIEITFSRAPDGAQKNDCRDLICNYLADPSSESGRAIAERLEEHTDGRSGLGLLFLIVGLEDEDYKVVISRFPTDNAIYVDENPNDLTVEFLERVFMKNRTSYKAVSYRDNSIESGLWSGRAIDKQLNSPSGKTSDYWISKFLYSQFTVTAAAGTRRLAIALRDAVKKTELNVKQELIAAAILANGLEGQRLSINEFGEKFGLSQEAIGAIARELKTSRLAIERFQFEAAEFQRHIAVKSVELSNGGILTAPSSDFDLVFHQEFVDEEHLKIKFTTVGRVTNENSSPQREALEVKYRHRHDAVLIRLARTLEVLISDYMSGQPRIDRITARAKGVTKFSDKAEIITEGNIKYTDPLSQIQGQIGARIVVFYKSDVERIDSEVNRYFTAVEIKKRVPESESSFGYFGHHLVLVLPSDVIEGDMDQNLVPHFFELQIKTLFQHAWSEAYHDLGYKAVDEPLTSDQKRLGAYTSAQAWGADHIFDQLYRDRTDLSVRPKTS